MKAAQRDEKGASGPSSGAGGPGDAPPHRYTARLANEIEARWQERWEREKTFLAPNPGEPGFEEVGEGGKAFVLDMFPYPSGAGLHIGHPLGYIATDIYARYLRMNGRNVLHAMGYDAFGLPAEQYAVQTGQHPRITTEQNIARMREQLSRLGLGHDDRRSVATTDVAFYKWTQWIFLQIFNAWYDPEQNKARHIDELVAQFEAGKRSAIPYGAPAAAAEGARQWSELGEVDRRRIVDTYRLAYLDEIPVNWCPSLGTVLANEEVTADGRSERGDHPVHKRPLRQWMMRITAYAERLLRDLEQVDWPEPIKLMQRNWIGRSEGAYVEFPAEKCVISVFTTRPDTLFGATYMVLAPEHALVDALVADKWPEGTKELWKGSKETGGAGATPKEAVAAYRRFAESRTDIERQAEAKRKTGVFTGAYATNPTTGEKVPVFIADYVLMGYGTGAIMAVPGHDDRDFEFARQFELPIRCVVRPDDAWRKENQGADIDDASTWKNAFSGEGAAVNSANAGVSLDGKPTPEAKKIIGEWLESSGHGRRAVNYKLRDWLFSRQRYWGEPFPIVYDEDGSPRAVPESMLPVELPELEDFRPEPCDESDPAASVPLPPLARAKGWTEVELDLGEGKKRYARELNTMPQWAGSCWYYLRYLDPANGERFCDPVVERYWMSPRGVDLYVGGAEHAVLHLLYARFWHKVLHDLGHVSTVEPFGKLFNQGYIQAPAFRDARGVYVPAEEVKEDPPNSNRFVWSGQEVSREFGKMGKSLKNSIAPDDICRDYGADTLRLYEMYMGPLEASKPWNTRDIVGVQRFLQRLWRLLVDEHSGAVRVSDAEADDESRRLLHKTIAGVREDMEHLRFNTAIAKLIELTNHLTQRFGADAGGSGPSREAAEAMAKMLAPLAPHMAEELWSKLGHGESLARAPFPEADPSLLTEDTVEIPVQINGKLRAKIVAPADADKAALEKLAMADEKVQANLEGKTVRKVIVVPGKMVNVVVG
ncbi:MAG: leucine--tRNA ligase [Phycisphaeraceae bacterium]|nr:MAG: leucine--tRNA ligase [Phycisphaeraceae bacterium]